MILGSLRDIGCWVCFLLPLTVIVVYSIVGHARGWFKPYKETHKAERIRAEKGDGRGIDQLVSRVETNWNELRSFEPAYSTALIAKRRGGTRRLSIPNRRTKELQRRILKKLLAKLKTHPCATGFDPGVSIAHNASMHVGQAVVIKLDIKDFFPSTTAERVEQYFRRIGWDADCAALLTKLTTHDGGLPQGAPTSPRLSNLVNYVLDCRIERYVKKHGGVYTRYADDITISYPEDWPKYVRGTIQCVRQTCKGMGYTVHTRGKLRVVRRHQQQRVTGLVVNDKVQLPRKKRRELRAVQHHLEQGKRATMTAEQLAGWRALEGMIERQTALPPLPAGEGGGEGRAWRETPDDDPAV